MKGWSWIFLLEGVFIVVFGVCTFFILPNDPSQVITFRPEHVARCEERLRLDTDFSDAEKVNLRSIKLAFTSPHVLISCLVLFASGTCLYGLAYFTPSIVQTFGHSKTRTQLLIVPPFACGFVATMVSSYLADRYKQRGLSAIAMNIFALVGAAMTINARSLGARYTALCLLITGVYASAPSLIAWVSNNSAGHVRRATAIAMGFVSTNSGGICKSNASGCRRR